MNHGTTYTLAKRGTQVQEIVVEADIHPGLPRFTILGLATSGSTDVRERVRVAIKNSGYSFPRGRITVNLSPIEFQKQGTHYDLSIAVAILIAQGTIPATARKNYR